MRPIRKSNNCGKLSYLSCIALRLLAVSRETGLYHDLDLGRDPSRFDPAWGLRDCSLVSEPSPRGAWLLIGIGG